MANDDSRQNKAMKIDAKTTKGNVAAGEVAATCGGDRASIPSNVYGGTAGIAAPGAATAAAFQLPFSTLFSDGAKAVVARHLHALVDDLFGAGKPAEPAIVGGNQPKNQPKDQPSAAPPISPLASSPCGGILINEAYVRYERSLDATGRTQRLGLAFTPEEEARILDAARGTEWRTACVIARWTGLRLGDVCRKELRCA